MKARDTYKDDQRPAHISVKEYMDLTVYSPRDRKNLKRRREHAETNNENSSNTAPKVAKT